MLLQKENGAQALFFFFEGSIMKIAACTFMSE